MVAIEMLAGCANFMQTTVSLLFSSPAAPGYPKEPLTPQMSLSGGAGGWEKDNECLPHEAINL